jgi:hypothetical protein
MPRGSIVPSDSFASVAYFLSGVDGAGEPSQAPSKAPEASRRSVSNASLHNVPDRNQAERRQSHRKEGADSGSHAEELASAPKEGTSQKMSMSLVPSCRRSEKQFFLPLQRALLMFRFISCFLYAVEKLELPGDEYEDDFEEHEGQDQEAQQETEGGRPLDVDGNVNEKEGDEEDYEEEGDDFFGGTDFSQAPTSGFSSLRMSRPKTAHPGGRQRRDSTRPAWNQGPSRQVSGLTVSGLGEEDEEEKARVNEFFNDFHHEEGDDAESSELPDAWPGQDPRVDQEIQQGEYGGFDEIGEDEDEDVILRTRQVSVVNENHAMLPGTRMDTALAQRNSALLEEEENESHQEPSHREPSINKQSDFENGLWQAPGEEREDGEYWNGKVGDESPMTATVPPSRRESHSASAVAKSFPRFEGKAQKRQSWSSSLDDGASNLSKEFDKLFGDEQASVESSQTGTWSWGSTQRPTANRPGTARARDSQSLNATATSPQIPVTLPKAEVERAASQRSRPFTASQSGAHRHQKSRDGSRSAPATGIRAYQTLGEYNPRDEADGIYGSMRINHGLPVAAASIKKASNRRAESGRAPNQSGEPHHNNEPHSAKSHALTGRQTSARKSSAPGPLETSLLHSPYWTGPLLPPDITRWRQMQLTRKAANDSRKQSLLQSSIRAQAEVELFAKSAKRNGEQDLWTRLSQPKIPPKPAGGLLRDMSIRGKAVDPGWIY